MQNLGSVLATVQSLASGPGIDLPSVPPLLSSPPLPSQQSQLLAGEAHKDNGNTVESGQASGRLRRVSECSCNRLAQAPVPVRTSQSKHNACFTIHLLPRCILRVVLVGAFLGRPLRTASRSAGSLHKWQAPLMNASAETACTYALGLTHDPPGESGRTLGDAIQSDRVSGRASGAAGVEWVPESGGCRTPVVMVPLQLASPLFGRALVALHVEHLEKSVRVGTRVQDFQSTSAGPHERSRLWGELTTSRAARNGPQRPCVPGCTLYYVLRFRTVDDRHEALIETGQWTWCSGGSVKMCECRAQD